MGKETLYQRISKQASENLEVDVIDTATTEAKKSALILLGVSMPTSNLKRIHQQPFITTEIEILTNKSEYYMVNEKVYSLEVIHESKKGYTLTKTIPCKIISSDKFKEQIHFNNETIESDDLNPDADLILEILNNIPALKASIVADLTIETLTGGHLPHPHRGLTGHAFMPHKNF